MPGVIRAARNVRSPGAATVPAADPAEYVRHYPLRPADSLLACRYSVPSGPTSVSGGSRLICPNASCLTLLARSAGGTLWAWRRCVDVRPN